MSIISSTAWHQDTPLCKTANQRRYYPVAALPPKGNGFLSSKFPDALVTLDGEPISADIRILYRPEQGDVGDGVVVATTKSSGTGQWRVDGLNPNLRYDVVARLSDNNDTIIANVKPKVG